MHLGPVAGEDLVYRRAVDEMGHAGRERALAAARWARDEVSMRESSPTLCSAQIVQRDFCPESHNA